MKLNSKNRKVGTGNTLLFTLWVIAFLSTLIITLAVRIGDDVAMEADAINSDRALAMAERGIAVASFSTVEPGDPVLRQDFGAEGSFAVMKTKEAARINPNYMLANHQDVMIEMLVKWGADRVISRDAVYELKDWIDPDDEREKGGSESLYYSRAGRQGHPYNREFLDVGEMLLVDEFKEVSRLIPDWESLFTVLSAGPIDLQFAPAEVIGYVTEAADRDLKAFISVRNGKDGIVGTLDDYQLPSTEEGLELLNINKERRSIYRELLAIQTNIVRVISRGTFGGITVEISESLRYDQGTIQTLGRDYKRWNETPGHNMGLFSD